MCVVLIELKNVKKCCIFFVVPGNRQALLGMPDTATLNIININIDYIQAEITKCKTNIGLPALCLFCYSKGLYKHGCSGN